MKPIDIRPFEPAVNPSTRVAIVIPANFSPDLIAAGLALLMALKKVNQSVVLLSPTPARVGDSNLFDIDQLTDSLPSENFVITLKNAVPKLKRVKHFVDGEDLKFMLFPRENAEKFNPSDISHSYESASFDLVIALGQDARSATSSFPELGNAAILVISHNSSHIGSSESAFQSITDPEAVSVSELVARIIESAKLPVWEDLAYNIFQGLSSATNNFSVARVTQGVLETATWAVASGANHTALSTSQPQNVRQPREDYRPSVNRDQSSSGRDHDRRGRNRGRHPRPSGFDSSIRHQPPNQPGNTTPVNRPVQNTPKAVSDWESKPKIYQGSTIVEPELNK